MSRMTRGSWGVVLFVLGSGILHAGAGSSPEETPPKATFIPEATLDALRDELAKKNGMGDASRAEQGVQQVGSLWRAEDGDVAAFEEFVRTHFVPGGDPLKTLLGRFETALEQIWGHQNEIGRELRRWSDLDLGEMLEIDKIFAGWDVGAHVIQDMFENKAAFVILLNFPVTKLAQRVSEGATWTREQWAQARLASLVSKRIPAEVTQQVTKASSDGDLYISEYNIWMHHLLDEQGKRLFPSGLKLISHWNLRDQLKADYTADGGVARQRLIAKVMERIVLQEIPRAAINNPRVDWSPFSNQVVAAPAESIEKDAPVAKEGADSANPSPAREPDTRYQHLLATYHAERRADPYCPAVPSLIARRFEENRELPEERVSKLLEEVISSDVVPRVAKLIEERLGRKLEPFDIWYDGFQSRGKYKQEELDQKVGERYPDVDAFKKDLPRILTDLHFTPERAKYLSESVEVDPSRGAGHALGAQRKGDRPHLRTRFGGKDGRMDYKGYNIAIHELGHNVEQIFSLNHVDRYMLQGVPNTAFTEAIAFVFQARDIELLGLGKPDAEQKRLAVLNDFWQTYEISGPALVDMTVWHWMYEHPEATPAELREAVGTIARDIWNRYYAPVLGSRDSPLLGIYSHMISMRMYLPDYPIGHLIAFQIDQKLGDGSTLGPEIERMSIFGAIVPDLWMQNATGNPVSAQPMLDAVKAALGP